MCGRMMCVAFLLVVLAIGCGEQRPDMDLDARADQLRSVLRDNPSDCRSAAELGAVHQQRDEYRDATKYLELSLQHCPDDPRVRFQLGVTRFVLMEREQGVELMERAIRDARASGDAEFAEAAEREKQAWLERWDSVPDLDWNKPLAP